MTLLFAAMHIAGAAVLVYLGVSAWRSARQEEGEFGEALGLRLPTGRTPAASFRASLATIAAHRGAVFAFTFFPQFLPRRRFVLGAASALAAVQVLVIDGPYCAMIVLLASRARSLLSRAAIRRRMERALGTTLVCLGIDLAAATR